MSTEAIVQRCRALLDFLPAQALEEAQARHPKVGGFGVFPVYAPVEIIHAAGLMPIGLFGAGGKVELSHADSRFPSFICSIAKSTLELFLRGEMRGFEGVVFSSICDVARNLASLVKRNTQGICIEYLHMPQNLYSESSLAYTRAELDRFRRNLAKHLGRPITDEAIGKSLMLYNQVRRLVETLYEKRRSGALGLSAADLFAVIQAGTRLMPEDFLPLLEELVGHMENHRERPRDGVRVVIEGAFCEQPPVQLIDTLEAAGCIVRDDDLMIGWRLFKEVVPENGDPLGALARAYIQSGVYTSVRHDRDRPRTEGLVRRVQDAGAEAVVFLPAKFCEPALLDYVLFRQRLDEEARPHLKIEFEEKMWTFENTRTEVETFAESMLFD